MDDASRAELWSRIAGGRGRSLAEPPPAAGAARVWRCRCCSWARCWSSAAAALAAGGVIELGSPARLPFSIYPSAREGYGALQPGTVRMIPIHAPDPAGGPDWGMRVLGTTRGEGCIQVGRLLDGKLGAIGQDDAFGNDGRFHELPVSAAFDIDRLCACSTAAGRLFTNVTADERPASGWIGTGGRLDGCVPATAGPYEKGLRLTRRERADGAQTCADLPPGGPAQHVLRPARPAGEEHHLHARRPPPHP